MQTEQGFEKDVSIAWSLSLWNKNFTNRFQPNTAGKIQFFDDRMMPAL
jgi:hypothetical protein